MVEQHPLPIHTRRNRDTNHPQRRQHHQTDRYHHALSVRPSHTDLLRRTTKQHHISRRNHPRLHTHQRNRDRRQPHPTHRLRPTHRANTTPPKLTHLPKRNNTLRDHANIPQTARRRPRTHAPTTPDPTRRVTTTLRGTDRTSYIQLARRQRSKPRRILPPPTGQRSRNPRYLRKRVVIVLF